MTAVVNNIKLHVYEYEFVKILILTPDVINLGVQTLEGSNEAELNIRLGKMYHRCSTMARCSYANVEFARIFILTTDGTFFRV